MSAIKAWDLDVRSARYAARAAAGKGTPCDRIRAFTAVCESIGETANGYADPHRAARSLVSAAARAYTAERKRRKSE